MDFLKDLSIDKVRNLAEDAFNQAKPKTDLETKVYEILSHKNWGASSSIMNEIARDTFDYEKFTVITMLMWEAMENQRPAAWRVVFKGLTLLEHLVKNGSERCVDDARNHGHTLRNLGNFNYYEGTIDRGLGVREKSKQIIELLSDDDRIREERQKARKLREKFGGNLGGTGSGGGGGGGAYAGYGNDNWNSGGGGGYGNSGIGSDSGYGNGGIGSSRYGDSGGRHDEDKGYSGRYDNDTPEPAAIPAPTFASIPDDPPKKAKSGKKKKKEPVPVVEVVDLFSFNSPAPAPTAAADDEDFAGFQSAETPGVAPAAIDPFASAPLAQSPQFDAFGGVNQQSQNFGAFATTTLPTQTNTPMTQQLQFANSSGMTGSFMMGGSSNLVGGSANIVTGNAMGGIMNGGGSLNAGKVHVMGGTLNGSGVMGGKTNMTASRPSAQRSDVEDDFGEFSSVSGAAAAPASTGSSVNKLISLDGLSRNSDKKKDRLSEPIIANKAAAAFVQEKDQIHAYVQQANKGSSMSFAGIDGLNKPSMGGVQRNMMMNSMTPAVSMGMNPQVMGFGGASGSTIGMLDPSSMKGTSQQGMMMNPHMTVGGMSNSTMQAGMQLGMGALQTGMGGMQLGMGGMQSGMGGMQPGMGGIQPGMGGMQPGQPGMGGMQPGMGGMQPGMGGMQPGMGGMQPGMMNMSMAFNPATMGGQSMGMGAMSNGAVNNFGGMQSGMNQQQQGFR